MLCCAVLCCVQEAEERVARGLQAQADALASEKQSLTGAVDDARRELASAQSTLQQLQVGEAWGSGAP